jgi:hypothetical protein
LFVFTIDALPFPSGDGVAVRYRANKRMLALLFDARPTPNERLDLARHLQEAMARLRERIWKPVQRRL